MQSFNSNYLKLFNVIIGPDSIHTLKMNQKNNNIRQILSRQHVIVNYNYDNI